MGKRTPDAGLSRGLRGRLCGLVVQDDGMSTAEYSESSDYSRETDDP